MDCKRRSPTQGIERQFYLNKVHKVLVFDFCSAMAKRKKSRNRRKAAGSGGSGDMMPPPASIAGKEHPRMLLG